MFSGRSDSGPAVSIPRERRPYPVAIINYVPSDYQLSRRWVMFRSHLSFFEPTSDDVDELGGRPFGGNDYPSGPTNETYDVVEYGCIK